MNSPDPNEPSWVRSARGESMPPPPNPGRVPWWATFNAVMLFAPVALGMAPFLLRVDFVPHPSLSGYALGLLVAYYIVVFHVAKRLSGQGVLYFPERSSPYFLKFVVGAAL